VDRACDHDVVVWVEDGGVFVQEPLHVGQQIITKNINTIFQIFQNFAVDEKNTEHLHQWELHVKSLFKRLRKLALLFSYWSDLL
jgi:hypothetical protein